MGDGAGGVAKVLAQAGRHVASGNFYEAQQQYRTVFHRYLKKNQTEDATNLATEGALTLIHAGQYSSATDLALLVLAALTAGKGAYTLDTRARLVKIITAYPDNEPLRLKFTKDAIKWSSKAGVGRNGDPVLRHLAGLAAIQAGLRDESILQLVQGTEESAVRLAEVVFDQLQNRGDSNALYATQAVLQYLLLQNLQDAHTLVNHVIQLYVEYDVAARNSARVASAGGPPIVVTKIALLNFIQLLVQLAERTMPQAFGQLRAHYQPWLLQNSNFAPMLDRIGEMYAGVRPPANSANMFSNMFRNLFAGAGASDDGE